MPVSGVDELNRWRSGLTALLGFEVISAEAGVLRARMAVTSDLLAPNGYLHAASMIALADSACGFGTRFDLPDEANFTTIELKSNFLATTLDGMLECEARRVHRGRSTQVWDAEVLVQPTGRKLALFRCTQMVLYSA